MTASINRTRPFVDERGALTQYGWSVMQDIWRATGGAVEGNVSGGGVEDVGPVPVPGDVMEWG